MSLLAKFGRVAATFAVRCAAILVWLTAITCFVAPAGAQEIARLKVENYEDYGRLILEFRERFDLPKYEVSSDNGILIIEFEDPVDVILPDVSGLLPQFVVAGRIDPDLRGIRLGLKTEFRINKTEAGELLFIDILPADWVGVEPGLPSDVVEELSRRVRDAAELAEQRRKAEFTRLNKPTATVRVGRHPTFVRLIVEWSVDVKNEFEFQGQNAQLGFDWPVRVDLYALISDLPDEIVSATNEMDETGSRVLLELAEGVVPRFYAETNQKFIIDIDALNPEPTQIDLASLLPEGVVPSDDGEEASSDTGDVDRSDIAVDIPETTAATSITPFVSKVGSTLRVVFPFEQETAAAVFRRGDTIWMVFDSHASINEPANSGDFSEIAGEFSVVPAGGTSIVRIGLVSERLATLGSEGRSWVLSLGDVVLAPTEIVTLRRQQTLEGLFEIAADLDRPARVHQLRDPSVGDVLEVVTVFPPARGIIRDLSFVDFSALRSVHGLVIQPLHEEVSVRIEDKVAIVSAKRGLIVSTPKVARASDSREVAQVREGFLDLNHLVESDPLKFLERQREIMQRVSDAERRIVDVERLQLAQFLLANQLSYEALGVLKVTSDDAVSSGLVDEVELTRAAALVLSDRPEESLKILNTEIMADKVDALIWRAIAKVSIGNYAGARTDVLAAEPAVKNYPAWVRERFLLVGIEAAIEQNDTALAVRLIGQVDTARLDIGKLSEYELLSARIDEAEGRFDEALDTLGQVIIADVRPARAEAIYRTMLLLNQMDRLDVTRAAETLASEVVVWRGNKLEAKMLKLLAELHFSAGAFREAFGTVRQLAVAHPDEEETGELVKQAEGAFADLYLNGQANALEPIDSLTLYYDFRNLTPSGARGDEMIRNLARRLVKVDLLEQAADLLQYQVDSRLEGAAKAQIAADLAVIYLANRSPDKALAVLNDTRVAGIPHGLERQRRILEARALVDADREDLALDILSQMDGRDADLLRVDAHWRGKRFQEAGEIIERLYGPDVSSDNLTYSARMNLVKAGVAFVLADDQIGLSRLRSKFGEKMVVSPEWPVFDFVTGKVTASNLEFKKVAREVADVDSLNAFLKSYKEIYGPDGALGPLEALEAGGNI